MLKKKSTILTLIGFVCILAAMFFLYRETRENFDFGDFDETEPEEEEEEEISEPVKPVVKPAADETEPDAKE